MLVEDLRTLLKKVVDEKIRCYTHSFWQTQPRAIQFEQCLRAVLKVLLRTCTIAFVPKGKKGVVDKGNVGLARIYS